MLIKTVVFLAVFAAVFFIFKVLYPYVDGILRHWQVKRIEKITPRLNGMFLDVPLKKLMLIDVLTPLGCGLIGYIVTKNLLFALAGGAAGLAAPYMVVRRLEAIRRQKFAGQLVDGLLVLSSSLKAGMSLLQAFEVLIEEMPAPIAQEFSLVVRQMQMGASLEDALQNFKKRMRVDDLDMMITAIMVAKETGGNLPDIFSQVSNTIRERNKLIGRVNALCVQGKLQGMIMLIIPIGFGLFVYKFVNPHFFDIFLNDKFGRMLLAYTAVSYILGVFFIRKFSRIDI